jgi:transmembrane sensor
MSEIKPELLEKYLSDRAAPHENQEVEAWMKHNDIDRSMLHKILNPSEGVRLMLSLDPERDWHKVRNQAKPEHLFLRPWMKVAASVIAAILIGALAYNFSTPDQSVALHTIKNTTGEVQKVLMEDGSVIYLNRGASITYTERFKDERNLELKGEGFFDVKRDESHPFVINADPCTVTVLGTSFSVNTDSTNVEVIVKTGKVELRSSGDKHVILEKNEKGLYDATNMSLAETLNNDLNSFSWQTGILVFEDTPLDEVVRDLGRYFNKKITLAGSRGNLPLYTSRFDHPQITEVLEEMKLVLPVEYALSEKSITVKLVSE